jgi:hypothetical protein
MGSWLVRMVDRISDRSSMTSRKSLRSSSPRGASPQSSTTIAGAVALATRLLGEGTGQVRFSGAGLPGDDEVVMLLDPSAAGQLTDDGLVELPTWGVVDILQAGAAEFQLGFFEPPVETFVLSTIPLDVDEVGSVSM